MLSLRKILIVSASTLMLVGGAAPAVYADTAPPASQTTLTPAQEQDAAAALTEDQVASYPCRSTDHFAYSVTWMEHFLHCNHIPFDTYTIVNPDAADVDTGTVQGPPVTPTFTPDQDKAGGPSCSWVYGHIVERCSQRGVPHLVCMQYWSGSYYPYHCGPAAAYNLSHAESLWTVVKGLFRNHYAQACTKGALVSGSSAAVIMKVTGKASGIGFIATSAMGCVGGLINYWWKVPS